MNIDIINYDFFKNIQLLFRLNNIVPYKKIDSILNFEKVLKKEIKGIIFDVDQTITTFGEKDIQENIFITISRISKKYKCCLLSNYPKKKNRIQRLQEISKKINIPIVYSKEKKPSPLAFITALEELQLDKSQVAMIGDRIFTDILGANNCGLYTVLVKPINIFNDPFFFITIPRVLENILLKVVELFIKRNIQ